MPPLLEVRNLHVSYGHVRALRGVSLSVMPGEFLSIIGPNGAGKSTLLRTISGVQRAREGSIVFDGQDVATAPASSIVRRGIGHCPEGRRLWPDLTVQENLELGGYVVRDKATLRRRLAEVLERFPRLHERRGQRAGTLSGGEQQMVAIGRVLMGSPRLVMFDEPSLGLSPKMVQEIMAVLEQVAATGVAILLVEQNAVVALSLSNRAVVIAQGQVVASAPSADLIHDPNLLAMYLGGETRAA